MKMEKNKLVFATVLVCIVLFIGGYTMMVLEDDEEASLETNQIPLPDLDEDQLEYDSKLEAVDALKEERETNVPPIYDETLLDSTGVYDASFLEKEKMRKIDSIYNEARITYAPRSFRPTEPEPKLQKNLGPAAEDNDTEIEEKVKDTEVKARALEHQLFFASHPLENDMVGNLKTDATVFARVDGTQVVKKDYRLQMRLTREALINNIKYPRNTLLYGFVSFKPNRTIFSIENINHNPVTLKSFDLQDGSQGINVQNTFQAEAGQEVMRDVVDDVNIVGMPQVSGLKRIFQRNNRKTKATIYDNYKLILKPISIK